MSEEDEKQALEDLENNIPYDYCRSCDSPDGLYHEYIDEDSWQYKIKMMLEEKNKEIECLNHKLEIANNKLNMIKNNVQFLTPDKTLEIVETYTGFFGKEIKGGLYEEII